MAAAATVDHHHHGLSPTVLRRRRLRSFPHPDSILLDLDSPSSSSSIIHRSFSTPSFPSSSTTITNANDLSNTNHIVHMEIIGGRNAAGVHPLVVEAAIALASGTQPIPVSSNNHLTGAYLLRNRTAEPFAVVKPIDEEPLPRWLRSVHASEIGAREAAAYLLDHNRFSGVPPTALIKFSHPLLAGATARRVASIQRFVPHDFEASDLGPSRFSITSVHRIGILDVRLLNVDRHAGNILVKRNSGDENDTSAELVPIDHGLCLPEILDDPYFEWLHWPQAAVPFSEAEAEYIASLHPFKDADILRLELPMIKESSVRILVLCTVFLKGAAAAGLCLADIGGMMTREFHGLREGPSALEALCKKVEEMVNVVSSIDGDEHEDEKTVEFQFEMEDENEGFAKSCIENVLDIPLLLQHKPVLNDDDDDDDNHDNDDDKNKMKVMTKSMSFSAAEFNQMKCISFGELSEEDWRLFLDKFEHMLPEAFEDRKKNTGLKQRLGTSCKF
ncbi:1-phosphatidylinositol 4-kinase protein [Dioscorea alata]|uniref:1-phosphatidylinositol 4-kinase protein n=1 Tax=Dioscorea alata TaxID=55571 RepID=A0ACB7V1U5_DIOAL|nr:1-phosphatidylinositol 4-kinase protein [Dioscorea alata]